jgi:uncharacterized protein YbjT (DUF2867 family)
MQAIIAGATGLVGGKILDLLLADPAYERVHMLVRRAVPRAHEKLASHVVDFDALASGSEEAIAALPEADHVFVALGTTIKKAGSQEAFRTVDFGYVVAVAKAARARGARRIGLVSSLGADAGSRVFYNRVKGEAEDVVKGLAYEATILGRPSILDGDRQESRPGERVGLALGNALSFAMVGGLRKYRPIPIERVARGILRAVKDDTLTGTVVLESDELAILGQPL